MKRRSPAWALYFLSPVIGELLSGSSPPVKFFAPLGFLFLCGFYGSGAILARELTFRWKKGWASLLLLGAAYGVVEEGLAVKSFFDPHWKDLGPLGSYGRWLGVNWVWSLQLTIYHAVFSIAIPVLLATLLYPDRRDEPWVSPAVLKRLGALFAAVTIFFYLAITPYRPPIVPYLGAVLAACGLGIAARRLPHPILAPRPREAPRPWKLAAVGFAGTVILFLCSWTLPYIAVPPLGTMLLTAGWTALVGVLLLRMTGNGSSWDDGRRLALASGALGFFILLAPLSEMDPRKRAYTHGMTLVGIAAVLFLLWVARRCRSSVNERAIGGPT